MRRRLVCQAVRYLTLGWLSNAEKLLNTRLAAELLAAETKPHHGDWKETLERVVPAIVSLKLNSPKVRLATCATGLNG